jgi:hypothetical protein
MLEIPPDRQDIKSQTLSVRAHTGAPIRITTNQSTTGFETISSCSLEPAEKNTNDRYKDRGGVTNQLQLSSQSSIETNAIEKATDINSIDLHILGIPTTSFTASEANEEKKHSRDTQPDSKSGNRIYSNTKIESGRHYPTHQGLIDQVTSLRTDSITNLKKPLTRVQARRQQPMQQSSNHSTEKTLRQKLNATEKRKLRELKSKNRH